jgi:exodeoxyribonuclease V beta subunit
MSSIRIINDQNDIDIKRHGVIEAHAGTGKTHTIVEMVLEILEQTVQIDEKTSQPVHIREVLLVTYTEKAAGELKKRIREGLEKRIRKLTKDKSDAPLIRHLEDCLNTIHESYIGTIHGVCYRLLQTWPFETGVHFETEMVDDSEGLAEALRTSMRTRWQDPATAIPWALERLQERGFRLEEQHFLLVREIAKNLLDRKNTLLDRRFTGGLTLPQLKNALEGTVLESFAGQDLRAILEKCMQVMQSIVDDPKECFNDAILSELKRRIGAWKKQIRDNTIDPDAFRSLKTFNDGKRINTPTTKKHPLFEELAGFHECIPAHPCLRIVKGETLLLTLIGDAAEILRDLWTRTKQEKGLISFQDMLRLMHKAVIDNKEFCARLRQRLRYAIIDEFQDTSILQWRIFERLFLETSGGNEPRLFIVGDPKQSIYSFQGADVQSYLAAKSAIQNKNGQVYGLINNYRSLPEILDGYNTIFGKDDDGPDWFAFDESPAGRGKISYPSFENAGGRMAQVPEKRTGNPENSLPGAAVQVMMLEGNAPRRRRTMAALTSKAIRALKGREISVPDGLTWKNLTLDYSDFAVIVEAHHHAEYFLEQFQADGIPAVKYKMEGVFQSPIAHDIHALLRAIQHHSGDPAPRLAALLTRFFNCHPASIDPEKDLEPCLNQNGNCNKGNSCIFHALEVWTFLASKQLWSQLFASILERTSIRERLIRLADGRRHLADLRQVSDYCIEKLYRANLSLEQLVEHLGLLLAEEASAGQDKNLFMLSTDKSSVRILTMHAAKGLEFPIVFVATGGSGRKGKGMGTLTWVAEDNSKKVLPMESVTNTGTDFICLFEKEMREIRSWVVNKRGSKENTEYSLEVSTESYAIPDAQRIQERRRLLYVALTRAQAMLFVPMHLKKPDKNSKSVSWSARALPAYPDMDLTPRLLHFLDRKKQDCTVIDLFDSSKWRIKNSGRTTTSIDCLDPAWKMPDDARTASIEIEDQITSLNLSKRICRQTSYTELSRKADSDRTIDRSEEENRETADKNSRPLPLPSSARTGDALHLILEELLQDKNMQQVLSDDNKIENLVKKYLDQNGILKNLSGPAKQEIAVATGAEYVNAALNTGLPLPAGGTVIVSSLKSGDRIPEMEFQLGVAPHWVHGFMDLVFRVENTAAKHPYRYFVLDWKSDHIDLFNTQNVAARIHERHYDLQARIYCHALDKYLNGVLGNAYDPKQNLGGAVYVFLRGFPDSQKPEGCNTWSYGSDPENDCNFTIDKIRNLVDGVK